MKRNGASESKLGYTWQNSAAIIRVLRGHELGKALLLGSSPTSLFLRKGTLRISSCCSNCLRVTGLNGEPGRDWQNMSFTGEALNLQGESIAPELNSNPAQHGWHHCHVEQGPTSYLYCGWPHKSGVRMTTSYSHVVTSATERISCLDSGWHMYITVLDLGRFCFKLQGVPFPMPTG